MKFDKINSYKKVFEKKLFFKFLLNTSKPCVWALVNEKHKMIYIHASSKPHEAIGRTISCLSNNTFSIKDMRRDKQHLKLLILEQFLNSKYLVIDKLKWFDHYKKLGYALYNTEKIPSYLVFTKLIGLYGRYCMGIFIRSSGRRTYRVTTFFSEHEAEDFLKNTSVYDVLKMLKDLRK